MKLEMASKSEAFGEAVKAWEVWREGFREVTAEGWRGRWKECWRKLDVRSDTKYIQYQGCEK